jgi:hypothetical protein
MIPQATSDAALQGGALSGTFFYGLSNGLCGSREALSY